MLLEDFEQLANSRGWECHSETVAEDEFGNPVEPWLSVWVRKWEPLGPEAIFNYALSVPDEARENPDMADVFLGIADRTFAAELSEANLGLDR